MGVFKNEVGRPSNEILKKRRIIYSLIALFVVGIIVAGSLLYKKNSTKKLQGAAKAASCKIVVENIKSSSLEFHYYCTSGKVKSWTLYQAKSASQASKSNRVISKTPGFQINNYSSNSYDRRVASYVRLSNLFSSNNYLLSIKTSDGKVYNYQIKTLNGLTGSGKVSSSYLKKSEAIVNSTYNSLTVKWIAYNTALKDVTIYYANDACNKIGKKFVSYNVPNLFQQSLGSDKSVVGEKKLISTKSKPITKNTCYAVKFDFCGSDTDKVVFVKTKK